MDPSASPTDHYHLFKSSIGRHLFVTDRSQIFDIPEGLLDADLVSEIARHFPKRPALEIPAVPPMRALSLNIAQSCNMACTYCYADEGRFGDKEKAMSDGIAFDAIDTLCAGAPEGATLVIGFMGGEPLLNRRLLRKIVAHAEERAQIRNQAVRFSLTTNATLLTDSDAELFSSHPFAVQISIDGSSTVNNVSRPMRNGGGSYERVVRNLKAFDRVGRPAHLSARMTVTSSMRDIVPEVDHLVELGFDEVGLAPVLVSEIAGEALHEFEFDRLLDQLKAIGGRCIEAAKSGKIYPFSNFQTAVRELHRGTHRPYPCGAGAGYLSVDADGDFYACHRLIGDDGFAMGNIARGLDDEARTRHLDRGHVDQQMPCKRCWARYLCGGGCHHEVARRGRPACDFLRSWLSFCLTGYAEISRHNPMFFDGVTGGIDGGERR